MGSVEGASMKANLVATVSLTLEGCPNGPMSTEATTNQEAL